MSKPNRILSRLLLLLLLPTLAMQGDGAVALHEVAGERAQVEALAAAFSPPTLRVEVVTDEGEDLVLLAGTRFAPADEDVAPVVSAEEVAVGDGSYEVVVFSLSPDLSQPSPLDDTPYLIDDRVGGDLLALLERIAVDGLTTDYGAQLAVWALVGDQTVGELVTSLEVPPDASEVEVAQRLFDDRAETSPQPDAATLPPAEDDGPAPVPEEANVGGEEAAAGETAAGGLPSLVPLLGGVFVVAVLLALTLAGAGELRQRRRWTASEREEGGDEEPTPAPRPPERDPEATRRSRDKAPVAPPATRRSSRPITDELEIPPLVLEGVDGPLQGRTLSLRSGTVISRSEIEVLTIDHAALSSPHALFIWVKNGVEVKDLNSDGGISYQGESLGARRRIVVPYMGWLALPGGLKITVVADGLRVDTEHYRQRKGIMMISNKKVAVEVLGSSDTSISDAHCQIGFEGTEYTIKDLNSTNGVRIDGRRLGKKQAALGPRHSLQLGQSTFQGRRMDVDEGVEGEDDSQA